MLPVANVAPAAHGGRLAWVGVASRGRDFWLPLAVIALAGVVIRVLYTIYVAPWPPHTLTDEFYYSNVAQLLAQGRGFIAPAAILGARATPTAAHPPLYVIILSGLAKLGGTGATAQRLTGSAFGAGTIIVVGLLGRRVANPRVGLVGAGLAAVYPILVTADGALMSESLFGLLIACSLLAAYRLYERRDALSAVLFGVVVGLAALTRDEAVLLAALILVPLLRRPGGVRAAAIAAMACVIVLTPWTVRNWITFGRLVPLSTGAGAAIAGANCQACYYGPQIGAWTASCVRPHSGNEAVATNAQEGDGLRYAEHHLSRVPLVIAARLGRLWSLYAPRTTLEGRSASAQLAGLGMYYLMIPLAIAGFLIMRRRGSPTWLIATPFILVSVVAALSYGNVRFREPADLALVILTAVTIDWVYRATSLDTTSPPVAHPAGGA